MLAVILSLLGLTLAGLSLSGLTITPDQPLLSSWATTGLWIAVALLCFWQWLKLRTIAELERKMEAQNQQTLDMNLEWNELGAEKKKLKEDLQSLGDNYKRQGHNLEVMLEEKKELEENLSKAQRRLLLAQEEISTLNHQPQGAELMQFLGLLQSKGRFVDFLMGDVSQVPDERMGAAARIVHQGCSKAIKEYLDIQPVYDAAEGSAIELDEAESPDKYRIIGGSQDSFPLRGKLLHRGWRTKRMELPKLVQKEDERHIISPAEVEVK